MRLILALWALCSAAIAGTVTLAWDASPGATGYRIYAGPAATRLFGSDLGNTLTAIVAGPAPGVTWFFVVTAISAAGESDPSNVVSITGGAGGAKPAVNNSATAGKIVF